VYGAQMPPPYGSEGDAGSDGGISESEIRVISDWIAGGAPLVD
jgi:hypothetical protein